MSPRLPSLRPREVIQAFLKAGFIISSQRGSHIRIVNTTGIQLVVPYHSGDLKRPLLKALIKQAGLTEDEFRKLL